MNILNLFKLVNKYAVRLRVHTLRRNHPHSSKAELSQMVIKDAAFKCAIFGAATAVPAVLPGIGTLVSLFAGTMTNIAILMYLMSKMVLEVAVIYDRDIENENTTREAIWAFYGAIGGNIASRGASRIAVAGLSSEVLSSILTRSLNMLGIRIAQRTVIARIVPVLGVVLAAVINYTIAAQIGKATMDFYTQKKDKEIGEKSTIVEGKFVEL
ncbi:MAG TPA: hypothetical protein VFD15_04635 [Clostridia bacterium]|nr:hypothetical protein [Clostridia bacterium]